MASIRNVEQGVSIVYRDMTVIVFQNATEPFTTSNRICERADLSFPSGRGFNPVLLENIAC